MTIERMVRESLEDIVRDLPCPEPDLDHLVAAGRAMRRRRLGVALSLAAAAAVVVVLAGLSFAWAGRSGRALEPVPARQTATRAPSWSPPELPLQRWLDTLPVGAPPATPYWRDGTLYVNGERIPAPFGAVDIHVAGRTVLVGGYPDSAKEGTPQWGLVRGGRLEPVPGPATRELRLSIDGRIAYWMDRDAETDTTRFFTWDTESNTALASRTLPGREVELWGVDAAGSAYLQPHLGDSALTRWDVRADTIGPTDLTYLAQAPETFYDGIPPWMHPADAYRSPDGTRRLITNFPTATTCCGRLRVRAVGPDGAVGPEDITPLGGSREPPYIRLTVGEGAGYWMWWESNTSVLFTVDGDQRTYLVRCPTTGQACQRVAVLGPWTAQTDYYNTEWAGDWGFARAPLSQ